MKRLPFTILMFFCGIALNAQVTTLKVWSGKIPGAIDNPSYKEEFVKVEGQAPRVSHVVNPDIAVFLPPKGTANGTAVIICPGGGYARLAIDHEGYQVAEWLNKQGIAGVVLRYRLPSDVIMKDKSTGPLQDAQEAMRVVRRNAKAWGIDSKKIGIMGFSAGGHLASTLSTHYNDKVYKAQDSVSARPDFSVLIYPVISMKPGITHNGSRLNLLGATPDAALEERFSNELQVTKDTPPAFLVHALDDNTVPVQNSFNYLLALKKYGVTGELHIYEKGGHGFGLGRSKGTESSWPEALKMWLKAHGLL